MRELRWLKFCGETLEPRGLRCLVPWPRDGLWKSRVWIDLAADWHKRLLDRMSDERRGRPAELSALTASALQEFLGLRHVVRSVYGYELDPERIAQLLSRYSQVVHRCGET